MGLATPIVFSWDSAGWILAVVLIAALAAKELGHAYGNAPATRWVRVLDISAIPLLVLFGIMLASRVLPLLAKS